MKSEDSENDLLRYLQDKQQRTRRMSQAIFAAPQLPTLSERGEYNPNARRKSLNPVAMADNYKRRLSLVVPQSSYGRRGASLGNVLKGIDSPARRRLRMKRWNTSDSSEGSIKENNPPSPASLTQRNPRRMNFTGSISPPSGGSEILEIIAENGDEHNHNTNGADKSGDMVSDSKPHSKIKRREKSGGSLKLPKTASSDLINEISTGIRGSRLSSNSSTTSSPSSVDKLENDGRLRRSSSTGSSRTKSSPRSIKFIPGRNSPSSHRKRLQRSNATSDPGEERWSTTSDPRDETSQDIEMQNDKVDRVGSLHKNISYAKALSNEGFD